MADYISGLPMSVFVYDFDYNAETPEELEERHEPFFLRLRQRRPTLPVLFLVKPSEEPSPTEHAARKAIIRATYEHARARGDENVRFVDYQSLYRGYAANAHTVDGCHPNDLGFYLMAKEIVPVLKTLLKRNKDQG